MTDTTRLKQKVSGRGLGWGVQVAQQHAAMPCTQANTLLQGNIWSAVCAVHAASQDSDCLQEPKTAHEGLGMQLARHKWEQTGLSWYAHPQIQPQTPDRLLCLQPALICRQPTVCGALSTTGSPG